MIRTIRQRRAMVRRATDASVLGVARPRRSAVPLGWLVTGVALLGCAVALRGWFYAPRLLWLYLAGMAFAITLAAVPPVQWAALWRGVLDQPSARKVHAVATPLCGGLAVFTGFAATVLVNFQFSRELKGVAVGAAVVVALGVLDDVFDVSAPLKLFGQLGATAAAMAWGVMLNVVPTSVPGSAWLNAVVTVLWFLTVTNAVQFLDGMDGLAAGLGAIAAVFFAVAALGTAQNYLMYLAAPLLGACLAFLPYNFRPGGAVIFLGDSGASFIGFTLAGLAVMGEWSARSPLVALVTPLLILAVPLFDIAFVGVVRIVTGKVHSVREWLAYTGRDHLHHRFEALGLTRTQSVLLIDFIAMTLGLSAILLRDATPHEAWVVLVQAGCVLAIIAVLEGVGRGRSEA